MDVQTRQFVEALKSLNEATKQVENVATTLLGGGKFGTPKEATPELSGDSADGGRDTNGTRTTEWSVSTDTGLLIDCLKSMDNLYGEILNAIEVHYGEEQEDAIIERVISKPYLALRDAIKVILLEVMEENLATIGSTEL